MPLTRSRFYSVVIIAVVLGLAFKTYRLDASIEIAAPPNVVKEKFLDFPDLPNYHPYAFFKSIEPANPSKPLEAGDKMHVVFSFGGNDATCLENTPNRFRWVGSLPGIFTGEHTFKFEPSTKTPGGTTFTQEEKFSGLLAFIMGDSVIARPIGFRAISLKGWEQYNRDLKAVCEGTKRSS